MLSSWSQLSTRILLCGFAIAVNAAPFHTSRQDMSANAVSCNTSPHKIAVSLNDGTVVGYLGAPNADKNIGLVFSQDTAHTFKVDSCDSQGAPFFGNNLVCTSCPKSANVIAETHQMPSKYPANVNLTMATVAHPSPSFAWSFDGSEFTVSHTAEPTDVLPFCWYDGSQSVSVLGAKSAPAALSQNCKFLAQ